MDGQADQKLIAQGRGDEIALTPAHLYYRSELATAAPGSEEHRIYQEINNAQFFYDQSPSPTMKNKDQAHLRDRVQGSMMTEPAIFGDGLHERRYRCQQPYIAFICALKGDRPDDYIPAEPRDKELFEDFDGTNFIWASQTEVAESLEKHRLLATTNVSGQYHPRFISPESSMGTLIKGEWQ